MESYDILIVGGGAAGLTAAIYTCRKKLRTGVISMDIGGQTNLTNHIENYPGVDPMPGPQLMKKFEENAKSFGAEIIFGKVIKVDKLENNHFVIALANEEVYECEALILAYGKVPKSLGIPGEEKFFGRGVSTCATCDAPLYKNKIAAVIGGGNSALEAVEELARIAKKVYLIHRRDAFRADEVTVEKVKKMQNVEFVLNSVSKEIKGEKFVKSIIVENLLNKELKEFEVNGVFTEIGYVVDTEMVKHLVKRNEKNEIITDERTNTSCNGLFACGDITQVAYKQTVISAGEGAKAGLESYRYLTGGKGVLIDWTH